MMLDMPETNFRLHLQKNYTPGVALLTVKQMTPAGWESVDTEEVEMDTLKDVLKEFYEISADQLRKV